MRILKRFLSKKIGIIMILLLLCISSPLSVLAMGASPGAVKVYGLINEVEVEKFVNLSFKGATIGSFYVPEVAGVSKGPKDLDVIKFPVDKIFIKKNIQ